MKTLKVRLTFTEPLLGTWPANQNVAREYIASKGPDAATIEDEVAALGADAAVDKAMTVFPRNEAGQPILYDYQVKGFFKDSNVFSYFGPAWFIDFSMSADQDGSVGKDGGWAATEGPQGFYWGGTWITAATGTDNPTLVADIMRTMTTNVDVMKEIVTADNDFINNKPAMEEMAADESYGDAVLGGQNPLAMFCAGADKIDLSNMSIYDQGCNEEFQNAMKNYFEGNATYDEALDLFYKAVVEKYPELSY